jgi:hypothetical protein
MIVELETLKTTGVNRFVQVLVLGCVPEYVVAPLHRLPTLK